MATKTTDKITRSPLEYKSDLAPIWCPGCGHYAVLSSLYKALSDMELAPERVVIVSGIGCASRLPGFVNAYGFHTVHGRALPIATGIKLANPELTVVAVAGDGDAFAIGGGHIPHIARKNVDLTYIVMDNSIYGQTKGQPSPTSPLNLETKASPYGTLEIPLNPMAMALAYGTSFVARGFSGRPQQLMELINKGLEHRGFGLIQVLSPCITFLDTYRDVAPRVVEIGEDHDPKDRVRAFALALEEEKTPLGIFYQERRPTFDELVAITEHRAGRHKNGHLQGLFDRFA